MVSIQVNGQSQELQVDGLPRVSDLVELVRSSIDPDHMITDIRVDGRTLSEEDWTLSPRSFGGSTFAIVTDLPVAFIRSRMQEAPEAIGICFVQFRDARMSFQHGESVDGNRKLAIAVNTLRSFFEWYATILQLMKPDERPLFGIDTQVVEISEVCNTICQQQMYQSWWAIGESLQKDLEPKLDQLEGICRDLSRQVPYAAVAGSSADAGEAA